MRKNSLKISLFFLFFAVTAFSALFLSKPSVFAADIVINEIMANPNSGEKDWIEVYNLTDYSIDLYDYYFDDEDVLLVDGQIQKGTSDPGSDPLKLSGLIPAKSTCFVDVNNSLNKSGDKPTIFLAEGGIVIDSYEYSDAEQNKTFARIPDGSDWQSSKDQSKSEIECSSLIPSPTTSPVVTNTPTSIPTLVSTSATTSTKTPTPKKTSTPKLTATLKSVVVTKFSLISTNKSLTPSKVLTKTVQKEVLGEKNKEINFLTKTPIASETPTIRTEVLGTSQNNILSKVLIGLGSVFILACGILAIKTYRKERNQN